jgi:redox-sensitive bicupin YhaK (pirin superfamily)
MLLRKEVTSVAKASAPYWIGDGFPSRTLFPLGEDPDLSPFLVVGYIGPSRFEPSTRPRGVGGHPHRGFETVTIVYQGSVDHRDSAGNAGTIETGDVQWMTAASGLIHEEKHGKELTAKGGEFEMVQLWVNLPAAHKMSKPGYQSLLKRDIPRVELGSKSYGRVIAGELNGVEGAAKTFTPLNVFDIRLEKTDSAEVTLPVGHNAAVVLLQGSIVVNGSTRMEGPTQIAHLSPSGAGLLLEAAEKSLVLILSGEPIDEPVVSDGPFVMNTEAEIHQAFEDYQAGRMGQVS